MHTTIHVVVTWPQKRREIMFPLAFTSSGHATIKLAAVLSMVAHESCNVHHSRPIGSEQGKEDPRAHFALKCQVPDLRDSLWRAARCPISGNKKESIFFGLLGPGMKPPMKTCFFW